MQWDFAKIERYLSWVKLPISILVYAILHALTRLLVAWMKKRMRYIRLVELLFPYRFERAFAAMVAKCVSLQNLPVSTVRQLRKPFGLQCTALYSRS
jgi:hypothetical protein